MHKPDSKQRKRNSLAQSSRRLHTSGGRKSHIGGLHRGWQQGKDFIPGALGVAIQVDGNLDLIGADFASNVANRPG